MIRKILWVVILSGIFSAASAQTQPPLFHHVEPAFWWIGMKNSGLQILVHNKDMDVSDYTVTLDYKGVALEKVEKVENPHYLFITLGIASDAAAGFIPLQFTKGGKSITYHYELKNKDTSPTRIQGFNSADVLYLIMPDRFANGDPKNDSMAGMYESANRDQPGGRHGGDLQGISDHLDYLKDLGVTALWLNPVLENNQPTASYHGYAITDLYKVDSRFGSNEDYVSFIEKCHQNKLKVIQDMVMNHIGSKHWLMQDLPEKDWIHQFPTYTRSNYRGGIISDPYAAGHDAELMSNGWFDKMMPDVNQKNELFATYLIQNTLWWIEYAGIDGIRMDTYPYPDKDFMAQWAKTVMEEYPDFNIVGEVWIDAVGGTAYWQKDMKNEDGYNSFLPSVTDFPLSLSIPKALSEPGGWDTGFARLYNILGQDFIYPDANGNVIFVDNHDMTRYFLSIGKDIDKFKQGMAFLLTTRGIPQLYYGTELLMDGDGAYHPNVRLDFPGGWAEDTTDAFLSSGRTESQNEAHDFLRRLLNWRKSQPLIHTGKLTHYIPEDNIYVYFRTDDRNAVMVVLNGNDKEKKFQTERFKESIKNFTSATNIFTGENIPDLTNLVVPKEGFLILELENK